MPSVALREWETARLAALDEIEDAHRAVGGRGKGRRYATLQINHAYTTMLSGQFQGFCRALHSAAVNVVNASGAGTVPILALLGAAMIQGRALDKGNPNAGNIGSDFARLGMPSFWDDVYAADARNRARRKRLDTLNMWRNAIAHQDFTPKKVDKVWFNFSGGTGALRLGEVRAWRFACAGLATSFDRVVGAHLAKLLGSAPW
jgi:hypothetical protein